MTSSRRAARSSATITEDDGLRATEEITGLLRHEGLAGVGDHRVHWRALGPPAGPPVVLLHTGLGSADDWRSLAPALADAGYRVIAYDRWGYGRSDAREDFAPPAFGRDLADLLALLDDVGVRRAALVGQSDGGTIALEAAAMAPERVAAVVAVAAHAYVELAMRAGMEELRRRYAEDEAFRSALTARHGAKADRLFADWLKGWFTRDGWAWDIREELSVVQCPALVVQGDADEFATAQHARDIAAAVQGSRLWLVPGAGHMLPQAEPEAFVARLLGFLVQSGWSPSEPGGPAAPRS